MVSLAVRIQPHKIALVVDATNDGIEAAREGHINSAEKARIKQKAVNSSSEIPREIIANDLPGIVDAKGPRAIRCGGHIERIKDTALPDEPVRRGGRIQVIPDDLS